MLHTDKQTNKQISAGKNIYPLAEVNNDNNKNNDNMKEEEEVEEEEEEEEK